MSGNSAAVLEKKRDLQPGQVSRTSFSIQLCLTLTHVSYEASLLKHQVCFSLRDSTSSKGRSGWGRTPTAALKNEDPPTWTNDGIQTIRGDYVPLKLFSDIESKIS